VPASVIAADPDALVAAAARLRYPLALKGLGIAHKSEPGAVVLGIADPEALLAAAGRMAGVAQGFLAEEMVLDVVAELLVGVTRDETGLMLLTLGAGGVLAELVQDAATLTLPATRADIRDTLAALKAGTLLNGHRGRPAADIEAVLDAVEAVARYAEANAGRLVELDVNPLIATPRSAVAADALIRVAESDCREESR
jgi:hypothetical protein